MSHEDAGATGWRRERLEDLLVFAAGAALPAGGFGWLDDAGEVDGARPRELWINARMTYVFSLGALTVGGHNAELAAHGVAALDTTFRDRTRGGWRRAVGVDGEPTDDRKSCYDHAFVILAAAAATEAGVDGARALLDEALEVHLARFWDTEVGACADMLTSDWSSAEPYRGANANMHTVEAWIAAADTTGDDAWLERAARIASRVVDRVARSHDWRVIEHFDESWTPQPEVNRDQPDDPFRPFGATPGHAFEWSRLLLQLDAATSGSHPWMPDAAQDLFDRAVADVVTGDPGIPYTTDWSGEPVVSERFHWVAAEAVMAADALARVDEAQRLDALRDRWWGEIARFFITDTGAWRHELSATMEPSSHTWQGAPDAYHPVNALLMPDLPLSPSPARALREGLTA